MPRKIGIVASQAITGVALPTLSIGAVTNYNQSVATLNATSLTTTVSTSVVFQYSTASNFSSFSSATAVGSPFTANTATMYVNVSGLTENTTYYVRAVATNTAGSTTTTSVSFATWHLIEYVAAAFSLPTVDPYKQYGYSTSLTVPTVTPTGGSAVTPSIYELIMFGSGAQSNCVNHPPSLGAGCVGPGGYRSRSSYSFTNGTNTVIDMVVGEAPFARDSANPNILVFADGQDTTISNGVPTLIAGGGKHFGPNRYPNPNGATSSTADLSVTYTSTPSQTDGASKTHSAYYSGYNTIFMSTDMGASGGGGGNGTFPTANATGPHVPGGIGISVYGYAGGAGSMGQSTFPIYNTTVQEASNRTYGSGVNIDGRTNGQTNANGVAGPSVADARSLIRFKYYGP